MRLLILLFLPMTLPAARPASADDQPVAQPAAADEDLPKPALSPEVGRKMQSVMAMLAMSAVLLLIVVLGSYLLLRISRSVERKTVGGAKTEYADAWSQYRVTDAQIAAATRDSADGDEPPSDDEPGDAGDAGRPGSA